MPDAKTLVRLCQAVGPEVIAELHVSSAGDSRYDEQGRIVPDADAEVRGAVAMVFQAKMFEQRRRHVHPL